MGLSRTTTTKQRKSEVTEVENMEIRREAAKNDLKLWEIAEACGMTDSTFSRKLRRELPSEQRNHILKVIAELAERKGV